MRIVKGIDLRELAGKTITTVRRALIDMHDDRERVQEVYEFVMADGKILCFLCDGGDGPQYATISQVKFAKDAIELDSSFGKLLESWS